MPILWWGPKVQTLFVKEDFDWRIRNLVRANSNLMKENEQLKLRITNSENFLMHMVEKLMRANELIKDMYYTILSSEPYEHFHETASEKARAWLEEEWKFK